jgi:predicted nucleic acid-binding protein
VPGYLLDTQTITYWFDGPAGNYPAVDAAVRGLPAESPLYVSAITLGEIEYGHAVNIAGAGMKRDEFLKFLRQRLPQVLDVSHHTSEPYGRVRSRLVEKIPPPGGWGKKRRAEQLYDPVAARELGIDENDLWIVAQAIERNLVLVTHDRMKRIRDVLAEVYPDFKIDDWTK